MWKRIWGEFTKCYFYLDYYMPFVIFFTKIQNPPISHIAICRGGEDASNYFAAWQCVQTASPQFGADHPNSGYSVGRTKNNERKTPKMMKNAKRFLSMLLAVSMVFGLLVMPTSATEIHTHAHTDEAKTVSTKNEDTLFSLANNETIIYITKITSISNV